MLEEHTCKSDVLSKVASLKLDLRQVDIILEKWHSPNCKLAAGKHAMPLR